MVLGFGVEADAGCRTTGGGSMGVTATAEAEDIAAEAVEADPEAFKFSGKCESTWASGGPRRPTWDNS